VSGLNGDETVYRNGREKLSWKRGKGSKSISRKVNLLSVELLGGGDSRNQRNHKIPLRNERSLRTEKKTRGMEVMVGE